MPARTTRLKWKGLTYAMRDISCSENGSHMRSRAAEHAAALSRPVGLELNFLPSPTLHDGRFANVPWLLELPEPISKLTWGNAALLSAASARKLGLGNDASPEAAEQPVRRFCPNWPSSPKAISRSRSG